MNDYKCARACLQEHVHYVQINTTMLHVCNVSSHIFHIVRMTYRSSRRRHPPSPTHPLTAPALHGYPFAGFFFIPCCSRLRVEMSPLLPGCTTALIGECWSPGRPTTNTILPKGSFLLHFHQATKVVWEHYGCYWYIAPSTCPTPSFSTLRAKRKGLRQKWWH